MPTNSQPAPPEYVVWCAECGRTESRTAGEVLEHTRTGWPKCCGQVMAYSAASERPKSDDTKLNRPALPSSGDTALDKPALPPE